MLYCWRYTFWSAFLSFVINVFAAFVALSESFEDILQRGITLKWYSHRQLSFFNIVQQCLNGFCLSGSVTAQSNIFSKKERNIWKKKNLSPKFKFYLLENINLETLKNMFAGHNPHQCLSLKYFVNFHWRVQITFEFISFRELGWLMTVSEN